MGTATAPSNWKQPMSDEDYIANKIPGRVYISGSIYLATSTSNPSNWSMAP